MKDLTEELEKIMDEKNIYKNELMSKHTSFKIGGTADYFVNVESEEQLKDILILAKKMDIPVQIIGNGTNLLVRDGGIRGIVVRINLKNFCLGKQEHCAYITVGAGFSLSHLAFIALENGLSGLECISGIPGTIGGAIRMNAGAFGKEIKDVIIFSKCMDKNGNIVELNWQEHKFDYRKSVFENNELIILETTMKLEYGKQEEIQKKMEECKNLRMKSQPTDFPNAGSTFKRNENIPTAKLIDDCGLKGYTIGGASVSTKHSGFIVNTGNATAKDVLNLVDYVKKQVSKEFHQNINLEVIVIGEE